jgi:hypothetical protein
MGKSEEERRKMEHRQGRKQMGMRDGKKLPPKEDRCGAPDAFILFVALSALAAEGVSYL